MTKRYKLIAACMLTATASLAPMTADAIGWPSNYEGVMLQGFYWDSYTDTKWTNLQSKADEYSSYFKLIWVPNSGWCDNTNNMGYMPVYWFTNHNSSFGTENELISMIQTYKNKGTGIIADVVINHRNGYLSWADFPAEEWNGVTYKIGYDGICRDDELAYAQGQPTPTGNYDEGENFDGCRDLDHTNANVQANCKAYVQCLQQKYGYVGCRYDMVKGYKPYYTGMYNAAGDVEYSVGEYFDSSYDKVANWIDETALWNNASSPRSAAFDFPLKYALNDAFSSNDFSKLVWLANGKTPQPAGMIHFKYQQWSVTFVDNHDTYRDGSKFADSRVAAANAFILFSPGTPCVFLKHYLDYKEEIQKLINLRNEVGITNTSSVKVLESSTSCYMAEITGTKGKAVIKVGPSMSSPSGYGEPKTYGNDYCVWTTTEGGQQGGNSTPDNLYIVGNLSGANWTTDNGVTMTKNGDKFVAKNVKLLNSGDGSAYFTFITALGEDWNAVNSHDRYGASSKDEALSTSATIKKFAVGVDASSAYSWKVVPGTYTITADFSSMKVTLSDGQQNEDDDDDVPADMPKAFYIIGEANGNTWAYDNGVEMTKIGSEFIAEVKLAGTGNAENGYFSFCKNLSSSWDGLNVSGNRYAPAADTELSKGTPVSLIISPNPADAKAYYVPSGDYTVIVNWKDKTIRVEDKGYSAINGIETEITDLPVRWFNLQGVEVAEPKDGIFIRVQGNKSQKVRK